MAHGAPGEPGADSGTKAKTSLTEGRSASAAELVRRAECYPALLEAAKAELAAGEGVCYADCEEGRPCATCQLRAAIEAAG